MPFSTIELSGSSLAHNEWIQKFGSILGRTSRLYKNEKPRANRAVRLSMNKEYSVGNQQKSRVRNALGHDLQGVVNSFFGGVQHAPEANGVVAGFHGQQSVIEHG